MCNIIKIAKCLLQMVVQEASSSYSADGSIFNPKHEQSEESPRPRLCRRSDIERFDCSSDAIAASMW